MSVAVDFKALDVWAKRQRIDTARLMDRSFSRAAGRLKGRLVKVMANGGNPANGVPTFHGYEHLTDEVRRVRGIQDRPMGGVLADKRRIVSFKRAGWRVIGWPDALSRWAVNFQDAVGDDRLQDVGWRRYCHSKGIRDVPRQYSHHPRPVMGPFGEHVRKNLDEWARGAFYKELARQFKKGVK